MGTTTEKLTYLNTTKALIKDGINRLGGELTNLDTFREYKEALDDIYDKLPKVTGTGSDLSLTPTLKGGLNIVPIGNCEQDTYTGKNLFNGIWELGYIDGNTGQNGSNDNLIRTKDYIEVTELTNYKFWIDNPDITIMLVYEYKADYSYNLSINKAINISNEYLTTKADTKYIRFRPNIQTTDTSLKCQFEKGTVATSYEPYVGGIPAPNPSYPQPIKVVTGDNQVVVSNSDNTQSQSYTLHLGNEYLASIPNTDYKDEIDVVNKKIIRKVGKVVLNGSESWGYNGALNFIKGYDLTISSLPDVQNTDNIKRIICDKFNGTSASTTLTGVIYTIAVISRHRIYLSTDTTFEESGTYIKNWLSNNNITCYYQLDTPIEETITDTTLISELNELQELLSYDGTTNITITSDSDNAQMLVQVSALKGE